MTHWTERADQAAVGKACEAFEKHRNLDQLFEDLVRAGMTEEEADEYVNLMSEGEE